MGNEQGHNSGTEPEAAFAERSRLDTRVWAHDLSRPLGEFGCVIEAFLRMVGEGSRSTRFLVPHYPPPLSPRELRDGVTVRGVAPVTIMRAMRHGFVCAAFATREDQRAFSEAWFA